MPDNQFTPGSAPVGRAGSQRLTKWSQPIALGQSHFRAGYVEGEFNRQDSACLETARELWRWPSSPHPGATQLSLSHVSLEPPELLTL